MGWPASPCAYLERVKELASPPTPQVWDPGFETIRVGRGVLFGSVEERDLLLNHLGGEKLPLEAVSCVLVVLDLAGVGERVPGQGAVVEVLALGVAEDVSPRLQLPKVHQRES